MNLKKKIIILGTGGTSRDIADLILELKYQCMGFLDDDKDKMGKSISGIKVIGSISEARRYRDAYFINGIGNSSSFLQKEKIIISCGLPLDRFITLIHPSASISKSASLGNGSVIFQNVVISSNAKVKNHVIILPSSVIGHDDEIEDYTTIASGACISGFVKISKSCYVGAGSLIKEGVLLGEKSLIGIGSVVLNNTEKGSVYVGNPAKFLRSS